MQNAQQIPTIWAVIQGSKGKSFDMYCAHLAKSLELRCRTHHIDRDKSIFLNLKFFEDLVALQFNPGGVVAQYQSAARGMSMLACRSLTAVKAKYRRDYEEAAAHTTNTRWIDDLLKGNRGKSVALAGMYMELKLNIGSYCGLLWSLFGDNCDYYKKLLKLYRILDREECFTIREAYTKVVCAQITWAIVDDGDPFLDKILWHWTLRRGHNFISLHPSSKASQTPSAMHLSSNGQHSHVSGYPWRHQNMRTAQYAHPPPLPARHQRVGRHLPRRRAPRPQHSQQGRTHVIQNYERLWTRTSYGTTKSSICRTYSLRPESE
jgi:hypothetical protein